MHWWLKLKKMTQIHAFYFIVIVLFSFSSHFAEVSSVTLYWRADRWSLCQSTWLIWTKRLLKRSLAHFQPWEMLHICTDWSSLGGITALCVQFVALHAEHTETCFIYETLWSHFLYPFPDDVVVKDVNDEWSFVYVADKRADADVSEQISSVDFGSAWSRCKPLKSNTLNQIIKPTDQPWWILKSGPNAKLLIWLLAWGENLHALKKNLIWLQ